VRTTDDAVGVDGLGDAVFTQENGELGGDCRILAYVVRFGRPRPHRDRVELVASPEN
jgi:hypothetical protein